MTSLDIDMGNTRTKWRCGESMGALPSPHLPTLDVDPTRVRVATVLRNRGDLAHAIADRYGIEAEFAETAGKLAGVRCGYKDPARLGVDRWLAAVAAWQACSGPVIVVSVGTAATVDFVDANGGHEGGFIAPGLRLLRNSLARETAEVRPNGSLDPSTAPGGDTRSAVSGGTLLMLAAFVDAAVRGFADRHGYDAQVFLTGGDADLLSGRLTVPVRREPHLVLDGLGIALP
ncbi:MAG: type III pantothenate kinase [Gammaproteobacteria bacterium]|nr:type III pantothenate kinase [Gammaproteobacteria bacterium]